MRQQRHQPLKTVRVGTKLHVPERYVYAYMCAYVHVCLFTSDKLHVGTALSGLTGST